MNEPQEYTNPVSTSEPKSVETTDPKRLFVIVLFGLIVISIVGGYSLFLEQETPVRENTTLIVDETKQKWNPEGSIFLTLAPKKANHIGIYKYNFAANTLTAYYVQENGVSITGKFETETASAMLLSYGISDGYQIARVSPNEEKILTTSDTMMKRHPSWSVPYEALVYGGKEKNGGELGELNEFNVYLQGKDGKEKKVTSGALPTLTPDGKSVIVLRTDGLYKVDLVGTTSEKIWGVLSGGTGFSQQFSVSPNGKYIAWTYPDGKKIYIMQVESWTPFLGKIRLSVDTYAFWPIFSPDEKYLAFEEVDWTDSSNPTNPRLVIMDLETLERRTVQDLGAFDQMRMFMSDWK